MKNLVLILFVATAFVSCKKDDLEPFVKFSLLDGTEIKSDQTVAVTDSSVLVVDIESFYGEKKGSTIFELNNNGTTLSINPELKSSEEGSSFSEVFRVRLEFSELDCQKDDVLKLKVIQDLPEKTNESKLISFKVE